MNPMTNQYDMTLCSPCIGDHCHHCNGSGEVETECIDCGGCVVNGTCVGCSDESERAA